VDILKIALILLLYISTPTNSYAEIYPYTRGNQVELLEDPHESAQQKIEFIRQAQDHIHIISFFWDDSNFAKQLADELIKAHKRGVEVRLLTSYLPSFLTDLQGDSRNRLMNYSDLHEDFLFIALKTFKQLITTNNLHEKIFLIDAEFAILGGRNISDSQFKGKDMEVLLRGQVVNQVQHHFHKMMNFVVDLFIEKRCNGVLSLRCEKTKKRYIPGLFKSSQKYLPRQPFYESDVEARILTHNVLIEQWKNDYKENEDRVEIVDDIVETIISTPFKKLRGYNYFIIPTPRYKNFLIQSLEEGKQIEIVTNSQTSASSVSDSGYIYALKPMIELSKKGLDIIEWRGKAPHTYLHTKVMIFDEDRAIIGSHNLGVGSTSVSNEIAVEINSPSHVARLIEIFENDKKDTELTNQVDTEFLKKKLQENKFMSFLLNFSPIAKTLSEFY